MSARTLIFILLAAVVLTGLIVLGHELAPLEEPSFRNGGRP